MLEKRVGERCCRDVVEKCCGEVWRSVVDKCFEGVLW